MLPLKWFSDSCAWRQNKSYVNPSGVWETQTAPVWDTAELQGSKYFNVTLSLDTGTGEIGLDFTSLTEMHYEDIRVWMRLLICALRSI